MPTVSEYWPDEPSKTRVWITEDARKEIESVRFPEELVALFKIKAEKGFQGASAPFLRDEGQGVWAYGTRSWTHRIAGYFTDDHSRNHFVIGGVWWGKCGKGNQRPDMAEGVVKRIVALKGERIVWPEGIKLVQKAPPTARASRGSKDKEG